MTAHEARCGHALHLSSHTAGSLENGAVGCLTFIALATGRSAPSVPATPRDEALGKLLPPRSGCGVQAFLGAQVRELLQAQLTLDDALAQIALPTAIALLFEARQLPAAHH